MLLNRNCSPWEKTCRILKCKDPELNKFCLTILSLFLARIRRSKAPINLPSYGGFKIWFRMPTPTNKDNCSWAQKAISKEPSNMVLVPVLHWMKYVPFPLWISSSSSEKWASLNYIIFRGTSHPKIWRHLSLFSVLATKHLIMHGRLLIIC